MKRWTGAMLLLVLILFGTVIGFNLFKQKMIAEAIANAPPPEFPVSVMTVKTEDWQPLIHAIGFIEPRQGVDVSSAADGKVTGIHFESGSQVVEGQVLVTLDASVERANLKSASGRMTAVKAALNRMRRLYKDKSVSKDLVDTAEAAWLSLQGEIESLEATIERRTVRAPFSGVVGLRDVYLGQYLKAGDRVVRLEDSQIMKLRLTIPQTELARIHIGQKLEVEVDAYPDYPFSGEISAIEPKVNSQSGLVQVEAAIPNMGGRLRSGMFAKASVLLPRLTDQVVLPRVAITYSLYGETVYVVEQVEVEETVQLKARKVIVEIGERRDDKALVLKGIEPGSQVVTSGQVRLSNGSLIYIVDNPALALPGEMPRL